MKSHGKTCITPTPFIIFANGRRRKANGKRRKTQRGGKDVEIDRTPHKMRITTYYTASYEVLSADNTARRPHADHTTLFINNLNRITIMKEEMNGSVIYLVESFLEENYAFRRNLLNGKTEFAIIHPEEEDNTKNKAEYTEDLKAVDKDSKAVDKDSKAVDKDLKTQDEGLEIEKKWQVFTKEDFNSLVRRAKKLGIGGKSSPRNDIEEYLESMAVPAYDPIKDFLEALPQWDGRNHVAELFGRIPGITSEQLNWCATWLRSAVAHWLHMDMLHGNEITPIFIGQQGCGKSTFANRLLPEMLRQYFLDHINFANKFDSDMALTHNLFVNIDELANMGPSQQGKLKQTLSKVKVNGRPIFGKSQEDRPRYASFLATTNDEHPLCDTTGSRRYICIRIPAGKFVDNGSPIDYEQLYAQVLFELREQKTPYWFSNDEVARIQESNLPYFKTDDMDTMLKACFQIAEQEEDAKWLIMNDIFQCLRKQYPTLATNHQTKIRIGQSMKYMGCITKRTNKGRAYLLKIKHKISA